MYFINQYLYELFTYCEEYLKYTIELDKRGIIRKTRLAIRTHKHIQGTKRPDLIIICT